MTQPKHLSALSVTQNIDTTSLKQETQDYFNLCREKLGFVPNVLLAYAHDEAKLDHFMGFYNNLMLNESGLTKLEREMIAVVTPPKTSPLRLISSKRFPNTIVFFIPSLRKP